MKKQACMQQPYLGLGGHLLSVTDAAKTDAFLAETLINAVTARARTALL
jgi:hypothetical protein